MSDNVYTIKVVSERLKVSVETIRRLISSGKLKAMKVGGQYVITRPDIEDYFGSPRRARAIFDGKQIDYEHKCLVISTIVLEYLIELREITDKYKDNKDMTTELNAWNNNLFSKIKENSHGY